MKAELRKTYFCEHCKKHMLSASSMARHEKYCRYNPHNKHKCFAMCAMLERTTKVVDGRYVITEFRCKSLNRKMYSYQLEKKASLYPFLIKFNGLMRMPLECNVYAEMTESEMDIRFHPDDYDN